MIALAAGPLTQLVLEYEQCSVLVDQSDRAASIPRASVFYGQGNHSGAGAISLTLAEQQSINSGIYSPGFAKPECSSGNCTYAPYTSIGFCSECNDISADVQFATGMTKFDMGDQEILSPWISSFVPTDPANNLPGGVSTNFSRGQSGTSDRNVATARLVFVGDDVDSMMVIGPPSITDNGTLVDCSTNGTWACRGYAASTCKVSPCIRNYTASMINGVFEEEVANVWFPPFGLNRWPSGRYFASVVNKSCLTQDQSSALRAMNYTLDDDSPWLAYNGSVQEAPIDIEAMEQDLLDRQCLYAIDYFFKVGLSGYFASEIFNGNITAQYSSSSVFLHFAGPQIMLAIYNGGDISFERTQAVWRNVSLSLTNYMRLNPYTAWQTGSGPPFADMEVANFYNLSKASAPAPGLTYTTKTCLQVRWGWLAFPTALAALTLVFFTGVVLSTGGLARDIRTWKSSPLPLLFFGTSLSEVPLESQHVSDLNDMAKRTSVRLVRDESGNMVLRQRGGGVEHEEET